MASANANAQIVIIDDDESIRETLKIFLEYEGYRVASARDGRLGLDLIQSMPTKPRLILLDLMMPNMDGWEFLETIGATDPGLRAIPVVVITAFADRPQKLRARQVIRKPVDLDVLLKAVQTYCSPPGAPS